VALPCDDIWVADGIYKPTEPTDPNATFQMVNGVGVYGGFEGTEEHRYERNWFENETILSGDFAQYEAACVITNSDDALLSVLDGFTITDGSVAGIYCEGSSPIIQHNKIMTSGVGIYCKNTEQPIIKNNWIYRNDYGMYFDNPGDTAIVRNNTVVYNDEVGIAFEPGTTTVNGCLIFETGTKPIITNCILWGNGDESVETQLNWEYMEGLFVQYSCIQDSNDVTPQPPYYTINTDPCFAGAATDNYLLTPVSPCIDAGDPCANYGGERDIDKHFRVLDGDGGDDKRVDMGADEYCNETSDNDADFDGDGVADGVVNYVDFAIFAKAWLSYGPYNESDPNTHNWNEECDLADDDVIDANDLIVFAEEWLWMSCEGMKGIPMMEMMIGMGGGMDGMAGAESMLISEPAAEQQVSETQSEPSVAEQIEHIKSFLDWFYEVKDQIDEEIWLDLTGASKRC